MRITPLDVRKQDFRKAVRGYDCDEVRGFLTTLAEEYETVLVDNKTLRETVAKADEKLVEYRQIEGTLRDTLMTAQRVMQDTKDNATREGGLIVQEAQQQARQILTECRVRTEELRREILMLRQEKETYLARFKSLADAQIKFVEAHESDFRDVDKRLLDMADSVVGGVQPSMAVDAFKPAEVHSQRTESSLEAQKEDVWRDYAPTTSGKQTEPKAVAEPKATPSAQKTSATRVAASMATAVEMASKGIPVPAVPAPEKTQEKAEEPHDPVDSDTNELVVPV